jgi:hypothetical protein
MPVIGLSELVRRLGDEKGDKVEVKVNAGKV